MKRIIDRRDLVKSATGAFLTATAATSGFALAKPVSASRYILITKHKGSEAERFANEIGPYIAQRDPIWMTRLEVLSLASDYEAVASLLKTYGPQTEAVEWPIIVAIPQGHMAGDDIELWSSEWLRFAKDQIVDACYPVSGGWWSVNGDWNPTAAKVRNHLFESPNHTEGHFTEEWLDLLNRSELQSIHSDHHREMIGQGEVHWQHVNAECPTIK